MNTLPGYLTLQDIAKMSGISIARMYQLSRERHFPLPSQTLARMKLYEPKEIHTWLKARNAARAAKRKRAA